jgi:hypothetical protein
MPYITELFSPLSEWHASNAMENDHKLIMYADNAHPHTTSLSIEFFEDNRMKTAPHLPYSPNIAPSDFFLLGMSRNAWPVAHSWMQRSLSKQFDGFLIASKT